STPDGHWEYCCMPFGFENAPAQFQRMMDSTFSGLKGVELFVYIDDLVSYAKMLPEHEARVQRLFNRLREAGLTLQPEKCKFFCPEVEYLGHSRELPLRNLRILRNTFFGISTNDSGMRQLHCHHCNQEHTFI
ncbi:GSCOCG00011524001-RA-CDS, partial [Cotesia congregata]